MYSDYYATVFLIRRFIVVCLVNENYQINNIPIDKKSETYNQWWIDDFKNDPIPTGAKTFCLSKVKYIVCLIMYRINLDL